MWELLDSRAVGYREGAASKVGDPGAACSSAASSSGAAAPAAAAATSTAQLRSTLRGNELRQALSSSAARTSDINVVGH
eukprot:5381455-Pleurochrysis_carterae.AAC.1